MKVSKIKYMFELENQIDYSKFMNHTSFGVFGNNQFEEKEAKSQFEYSVDNYDAANNDDEDFTLLNGKFICDEFEEANLSPTKEQSFPSDD